MASFKGALGDALRNRSVSFVRGACAQGVCYAFARGSSPYASRVAEAKGVLNNSQVEAAGLLDEGFI
eukprot:2337271-Lingulodinium_polyedra.AAC.1